MLFLVDGTWSQAKGLVRHNPALLDATTQVMFAEGGGDEAIINAIRREPAGHCMSTLEACVKALRIIEPTEAIAQVAVSTALCFSSLYLCIGTYRQLHRTGEESPSRLHASVSPCLTRSTRLLSPCVLLVRRRFAWRRAFVRWSREVSLQTLAS